PPRHFAEHGYAAPDLRRIRRVRAPDRSDVRVVGIRIQVDDRREVEIDPELFHLGEALEREAPRFGGRQRREVGGAREVAETGGRLQPPHLSSFLIDEDEWMRGEGM